MVDVDLLKNFIFSNDSLDVKLKNRFVVKTIDEAWISIIEDTLPALDKAIRKPTKFIVENDMVLNIEQSKNITARSIKDLAVHSNYIKKIDENGDILPSKILNVFRDETFDTYENRFLNTLVYKIYEFVKVRFDSLKNTLVDSKSSIFEFSSNFDANGLKGKTTLSIEIQNPSLVDDSAQNDASNVRVRKLYFAILDYVNCTFIKSMGKNFIRLPVVRTNALMKNPDLRKCLALWEFLEGYSNVGYNAVINDNEQNCPDDILQKMLASISEQCQLFNSLVNDRSFENVGGELYNVTPKFVIDTKTKLDTEFDIAKSEYKSVVELVDELCVKDKRNVVDDIDLAMNLAVELAMKQELEKLERLEKRASDNGWLGKLANLSRSFVSRLIQLNNEKKELYFQVRNALLKYTKIKNKISWHHESFSVGRKLVASLMVRGKTLVLCLNVRDESVDYQQYNFADLVVEPKDDFTQLTIKLKSKLAVKRAISLIDDIALSMQLVDVNNDLPTLYLPSKSEDELISVGLIRRKDSPKIPVNFDDFYLTLEQLQQLQGVEPLDSESNWFDNLSNLNRSYQSKIIQLNDERKEFYSIIKNSLLSYSKMKSRISWHHESFTVGRKIFASLMVRGKTLVIALNLYNQAIDYQKYNFADLTEVEKDDFIQLVIKLKSRLNVKKATQLIDEMAEYFELSIINEDLPTISIPYQSDEQLIKIGLIKLKDVPQVEKTTVETKDEEACRNTEENAENSQTKEDNIENTQESEENAEACQNSEEVDENSRTEEEIDEITQENADTVDSLDNDESNWFDNLSNYNRSYQSKLIQLNDERKEFYSIIKNSLLKYSKMKSKLSWHHENFTVGRKIFATLVVRGKTLVIFLNLYNQDIDYQKYNFADLTEVQKDGFIRLVIKLKSRLNVKKATQLIDEMAEYFELSIVNEDLPTIAIPYQSDEELVSAGLIKLKDASKPQEPPKAKPQATQPQSQVDKVITVTTKQAPTTSLDNAIIKEQSAPEDIDDTLKSLNEALATDENTEEKAQDLAPIDADVVIQEQKQRQDQIIEQQENDANADTLTENFLPESLVAVTDTSDVKIEDFEVQDNANEDVESIHKIEIDFSENADLLKHFDKKDIIAFIDKIRNNSATSILDQVETEALMCFRALLKINFFTRRRYLRIFKSDRIDQIIKIKEKLLTIYIKNMKIKVKDE